MTAFQLEKSPRIWCRHSLPLRGTVAEKSGPEIYFRLSGYFWKRHHGELDLAAGHVTSTDRFFVRAAFSLCTPRLSSRFSRLKYLVAVSNSAHQHLRHHFWIVHHVIRGSTHGRTNILSDHFACVFWNGDENISNCEADSKRCSRGIFYVQWDYEALSVSAKGVQRIASYGK